MPKYQHQWKHLDFYRATECFSRGTIDFPDHKFQLFIRTRKGHIYDARLVPGMGMFIRRNPQSVLMNQ